MNDKEFKVQKERVKKIVDYWSWCMGLRWYEINIEYKMGDGADRGDGFIRVMECVSRWEYRTATIRVWIEELPEDDEKLERTIVHELVHIFLQPLRHEDIDFEKEEYVTESLARAFIWSRDIKEPLPYVKISVEEL